MSYTEADLERVKEFVRDTEAQVHDKSLARLLATVRAEATAAERERSATKCKELGDRYDADSCGQRTCRELELIIRSGA